MKQVVAVPVFDGITMRVPVENFIMFWDRLRARIDTGKATEKDFSRYVAVIAMVLNSRTQN